MSRKSGKTSGGFVFNVLNIGFTIFMFALPSVALAYWYFYVHTPNKATVRPAAIKARPLDQLAGTREQGPKNQPPQTSVFFDESIPSSTIREDAPAVALSTPGPAEREQKELRRWRDPSGEFEIEARFYSAVGANVKLQTEDERTIEVEVDRLSEADKSYLRALYKTKGIRASF